MCFSNIFWGDAEQRLTQSTTSWHQSYVICPASTKGGSGGPLQPANWLQAVAEARANKA